MSSRKVITFSDEIIDMIVKETGFEKDVVAEAYKLTISFMRDMITKTDVCTFYINGLGSFFLKSNRAKAKLMSAKEHHDGSRAADRIVKRYQEKVDIIEEFLEDNSHKKIFMRPFQRSLRARFIKGLKKIDNPEIEDLEIYQNEFFKKHSSEERK